jgi:hypothetical protein
MNAATPDAILRKLHDELWSLQAAYNSRSAYLAWAKAEAGFDPSEEEVQWMGANHAQQAAVSQLIAARVVELRAQGADVDALMPKRP